MDWAPLDALPTGMVAYCRAGLFQLPGDAIAFDSGTDRLRIVPDVTGRAFASCPDAAVVEFAERAVGRITEWTDASWARENSRVWRAQGMQGGTWYVKVHQNDKFHGREVRGLRTPSPTRSPAWVGRV